MVLEVSHADGVTEVVITHPPKQLVDGAFLRALIGLLDEAEADPATRVLLLRSGDPDFFLMHGDVEQLMALPTGGHQPQTAPNAAAACFQRLSRSRLVSIGLIDGAARGGGCEFLSALDLRIGGPRTRIGQPEVAMGILPGAGGTARWPRLVGRGRALEILLTCRDLDADDALTIGWLDGFAFSDELLPVGRDLAARIASMPAESVAAVKRVVDLSLSTLEPALVAESDALAERLAAGAQKGPMRRFLAAGGQTRAAERGDAEPLIRAMTEPLEPPS